MSKYIFIKNVPIHWTEGLITRKFTKYGSVEEVTLIPSHPKNQVKSLNVILEFAEEDGAMSAVESEGSSWGEEQYTVSIYKPSSESSYVVEETVPSQNSQPTYRIVSCSNGNCPKQLINEMENYYCAPDCYFESVDMIGRINIYDKFIASLGRSGTGMLKNLNEVDKLTVTVNREGNRNITYYPPKKEVKTTY